jgi:glycerophosphoryl diester phosphodiesterase
MMSTITVSSAASAALTGPRTRSLIAARTSSGTQSCLPRIRRPGGYQPVRTGIGPDRPPAGPLILAHRGSSGPGRPENTVAAADAALSAGADGVEVDVRLSADGKLVCSHDVDLFRLAGTPMPVSSSTAAALRSVVLPGGHTLALLEELLSAVAGYGRRRVVVEAKACPDPAAAREVAGALLEVLGGFAADLDITVSCFDPVLLGMVRTGLAHLEVGTALLGSSFEGAANLLRQALDEGHDEIHPNLFSLLRSPNVAEAARTLGVGVTCWTVNRARHVARLADLGVEALITDDVPSVRAALRYRPRLRIGPAAQPGGVGTDVAMR